MNHLLLEYLIRQILSEEGFTSLNVRSFRGDSHKDRTDKFVDYLKQGTAMPLTKGGDSVVVNKVEIVKDGESTTYDPTTQDAELKAVLPTLGSGDKFYLYDESGKKHSITAVAKTADLGGRGVGKAAGGDIEAKQEAAMKAKLEGKVVTMTVTDAENKNHEFKGINGFERIPGNKKADFKFTGESDVYVQHKDPKHQQLAGVVRGPLKDDEQVLAFVKKVYEEVKVNGPLKKRMIEPITDSSKQLLAMYGTADGSFSQDAVQMYCIGDMVLEDVNESTMKLTASKIYVYPEIPKDDPIVIAATYRSGRNHKAKEGLIIDTRIGLYFRSSLGNLEA